MGGFGTVCEEGYGISYLVVGEDMGEREDCCFTSGEIDLRLRLLYDAEICLVTPQFMRYRAMLISQTSSG